MTPDESVGGPYDGRSRVRRGGTADASAPPEIAARTVPVFLNGQHMDDALDSRQAEPLSPLVGDYVRYQEHWWIADADRWLRIDDAQLDELLTKYSRRLAGGLYGSD
jgi:hypothetical protein